jgi:ribosomal protein S18 acetylase RimI-like enzyme
MWNPWRLRSAAADDANEAVPLMYSSGPELFDHIFPPDPLPFLHREFRSGRGVCGFTTHMVAEVPGEGAIGVISIVTAAEARANLLGTGLTLLTHHGPVSGARAAWRAYLNSRVIRIPGWSEGYIMNFGVALPWRGRGVGSALVREAIGRIRARGCRWCTADVREDNSPALHLMGREGMQVRRRKPRPHAPALLELWLDLRQDQSV